MSIITLNRLVHRSNWWNKVDVLRPHIMWAWSLREIDFIRVYRHLFRHWPPSPVICTLIFSKCNRSLSWSGHVYFGGATSWGAAVLHANIQKMYSIYRYLTCFVHVLYNNVNPGPLLCRVVVKERMRRPQQTLKESWNCKLLDKVGCFFFVVVVFYLSMNKTVEHCHDLLSIKRELLVTLLLLTYS